MEKIVGSEKRAFLTGQVPTENSVFNILLLLSPRDQANPFTHICSFTLHTSYKNDMLGQRGECCQNALKLYYKSLLVANFVQTCSLISIYNMYTVCSYDTPR